MPGIVRQALAVPAAELAKLYPQEPSDVLQAASRALAGVVAVETGWRQVQALGLPAQERFAALADRSLALARHAALRGAQQYLGRLMQLLADCQPAFGPAQGFWGRRPGRAQLPTVLREIDQVRGHLRDLLPQLDALAADHDAAAEELTAVVCQLRGTALACEYLMRPGTTVPAADRLGERALALTQAAALALGQQQLAASHRTVLDEQRGRIRDTVLTLVPAWQIQLAALPAEPNETERFSARDALETLLARLAS